jgi:hypothetical protein
VFDGSAILLGVDVVLEKKSEEMFHMALLS